MVRKPYIAIGAVGAANRSTKYGTSNLCQAVIVLKEWSTYRGEQGELKEVQLINEDSDRASP